MRERVREFDRSGSWGKLKEATGSLVCMVERDRLLRSRNREFLADDLRRRRGIREG